MEILNMLGLISKSKNIKEFKNKGAVIIDVRALGKFRGGHIKGSKNRPLDTIAAKISEIKN